MKTFKLSIALAVIATTAYCQETKDTLKVETGDSLIINETMKRKIDNKEIEINISADPSQSSIVIMEQGGSDTTRLKFGNTEILILEDRVSKGKKRRDADEDDKFEEFGKGLDKKDREKRRSNFEGHYSSINYGINLLTHGNLNFSLPDSAKFLELNENRSYEFGLNLFQFEIPIWSNKVGLVSGVGMTWNHYRFENKKFILDNSQPQITYTIDTVNRWTKNQLNIWSVQVPLLLEGQVPISGEPLWFAVGGYGALKLSSKVKLKNDDKKKTVNRHDYHLSPLMYGLTARMGYGNFGIYASYALNPFFKKSEGPELYNFTVGLTLTFND